MKKALMLTACALMFVAGANASVERGQKLYLKNCRSCHGNGTKGAVLATQAGWDKWFANGGKTLIAKHNSPKAAASSAYFNGAFKNQVKDLHDFLREYGSDSGNVPACS